MIYHIVDNENNVPFYTYSPRETLIHQINLGHIAATFIIP